MAQHNTALMITYSRHLSSCMQQARAIVINRCCVRWETVKIKKGGHQILKYPSFFKLLWSLFSASRVGGNIFFFDTYYYQWRVGDIQVQRLQELRS
jgi:hypothetical protein